eukprot:gene3655-4001_t
MVFAGQDAWRKHPLIANCYKKPLPGFALAAGIFTVYLVVEAALTQATAPTYVEVEGRYKFKEAADLGSAPTTKKRF